MFSLKCEEILAQLTDLAGDRLIESSDREGALDHLRQCERCASLYESQRSLSSALRAISIDDASLSAPALVETKLLSVLREQKEEEAPASVRPNQRRRYLVPLAAAILIGAAVPTLWRSNHTVEPAPATVKVTTAIGRSMIEEKAAVEISTPPLSPRVGLKAAARKGGAARLRRSAARPQPPTDRAYVTSTIAEFTMVGGEPEIATEFISLIAAEGLPPVESGQVIRINLPWTSLASFGLPIVPERATERVKADVLMGEDGLARAIRFVR